MKRVLKSSSVVLLLTIALPTSSPAQQNATAEIEPGAMEALSKMGAYLRSLRAFQVSSESTREEVLTDGQKLQHDRRTTLMAQVPDRLRAEIKGDNGTSFYFFNGKTFTLFARDLGYYATVQAPATLRQLADVLDERYGMEIPLVDLFLWGAPNANSPKITSAMDVGPSEVEGVTCEQYAFRQEGLDWQVWIQLGEFPLPRKLVLTTTTDEARPQHTSVLNWNIAPSYNEAAFTFSPPASAHQIVFASQE